MTQDLLCLPGDMAVTEGQRNGKFSLNSKFGQNGKLGHMAHTMTPAGQRSCYCAFRF